MSLTLQELNDIRERVRRDRERVARADLQAPGIPAMRSFEAVDREKLLEEVDLLKLEVGALTIELRKAKNPPAEKTAEFDFPFHLHGSPAREKADECPTCGYTPCQCDQT